MTRLLQNHPNPFNPRTSIRYVLANPEHVSLRIYDVRGQLVKTLVQRHQGTGWHIVDWDGRDDRGNTSASGVYHYRMTTGNFSQTRKFTILK